MSEKKRETERQWERDELHNHLGVGLGQKGWMGEREDGGRQTERRRTERENCDKYCTVLKILFICGNDMTDCKCIHTIHLFHEYLPPPLKEAKFPPLRTEAGLTVPCKDHCSFFAENDVVDNCRLQQLTQEPMRTIPKCQHYVGIRASPS